MRLSNDVIKALNQIDECTDINDLRDLERELINNNPKKNHSRDYSNADWQYRESEWLDEAARLLQLQDNQGVVDRRRLLKAFVAMNRAGNAPKAYHRIPNSIDDFRSMERSWLDEHGLIDYATEPDRVLSKRLERMKGSRGL